MAFSSMRKPVGWRGDSHRHYLAAKYGRAYYGEKDRALNISAMARRAGLAAREESNSADFTAIRNKWKKIQERDLNYNEKPLPGSLEDQKLRFEANSDFEPWDSAPGDDMYEYLRQQKIDENPSRYAELKRLGYIKD